MSSADPSEGAQIVIFGTVHNDPICRAALVDQLKRISNDRPTPDFVGVESTGSDFLKYVPRERKAFKEWALKTKSPMSRRLVTRLAATLFFDVDAHRRIFRDVETLHLEAGRTEYLDGTGQSRPISGLMSGDHGTAWLTCINEFRYQRGLEGDSGAKTFSQLSSHIRGKPDAVPDYLQRPWRWTNHEEATRDQVWSEQVDGRVKTNPDLLGILVVGFRHCENKPGSIRCLLKARGVKVSSCDLSGDLPRWF